MAGAFHLEIGNCKSDDRQNLETPSQIYMNNKVYNPAGVQIHQIPVMNYSTLGKCKRKRSEEVTQNVIRKITINSSQLAISGITN